MNNENHKVQIKIEKEVRCLPELLKIVMGGHEEHAETVETETDAEVVHERDPKVS